MIESHVMQASVSQPDVVLSWSFQTALAAGLAVACIGLAVTFGRPAMRVLAAHFSVMTVASILIWVALTARSLGLPPMTGAIVGALSLPLSPVLAFVFLRHLTRLLARRETRGFPSITLIVGAGAAGLFAGLTIAWLTMSPAGGSSAAVAVVGSVAAVIAFVVLTGMALKLRRATGAHRQALGFLTAAFAVLTLRSATNILVNIVSVATQTPPQFSVPITVAQVFLLVVAGVLLIVGVLDEDRASIVHTAEQIRHAEAALAKSERLESLGRMAGAVAHDFNNVLAVIGMSAESARGASSGVRDDDLGEILASSKRGQALTRQLLAFARQAPQQVSRFDANHQVEKLSGLLNRIVGKQMRVEFTLASTPQIVEMDVTQFEQVLMNLVVNARDSMPQGGTIAVTIAAGAAAGGANAGLTRISVTDTGTGIRADVLPHIFEPFFSTKTIGEGTGLGLATCDGIVRRSGGRIEVHTETGKGTRFDVLLPRAGAA